MAKDTVFDKAAFNEKVRSEVAALESDVEEYLASRMQDEAKSMEAEAKSKVDNSFKNTLAQFKASINVYSTAISTTSIEVYKFLLANHAVKNAPEIKNIDGTLIKEMEAYIAGILGTEGTVTTKDEKSYAVSAPFIDAGLATVTDNDTGRQYNLTWKSDAAKNSLYELLGSLKTWGQNLPTYLFDELKNDVRDALGLQRCADGYRAEHEQFRFAYPRLYRLQNYQRGQRHVQRGQSNHLLRGRQQSN